MRRPEGVPGGERRIERLRADVGNVVGLDEEMVERSVPVLLLVVSSLNRRPRENLVPLCAGGVLHRVKIPACDFGGEVALGRFHAAFGGKRDLDQQATGRGALLRDRIEIEVEDVLRRDNAFPLRQFFDCRAFASKLDDERIVALDPLAAMVLSREPRFADELYVACGYCLREVLPADAVGAVDEKPQLVIAYDAVDSRMLRRRDFDLYSAVEVRCLVSRLREFGELIELEFFGVGVGVLSWRMEFYILSRTRTIFSNFPESCRTKGHYADIPQVRAARSVQVRLREAADRLVPVAVAAAVIPVAIAGVRAGLDESERNARSRECVARRARPDERIDEFAHVNRQNTTRKRECQRTRKPCLLGCF